MTVRTHKNLLVWQKAISLAGRVYAATTRFPNAEQHPLSNHMRRSALSVASYIAEGAGRNARSEYLNFLDRACGSVAELETQIYVGFELNLIDRTSLLHEDVAEVGRLLSVLIRRLREHRERAAAFAPCNSAVVSDRQSGPSVTAS